MTDAMAENLNALNGESEEKPVVFFCKNCNLILGDSLSWLGAKPDRPFVTLSRNIQLSLIFCRDWNRLILIYVIVPFKNHYNFVNLLFKIYSRCHLCS